MKRYALGIAALGLLVAYTVAQDEAAKKDLERIQGVWLVESVEVEGKSVNETKSVKVTFRGDKASHPAEGGRIEEVRIKLDPSKSPKQIDITAPNDDQSLMGIYAIDRDTLKICAAKKNNNRPTEFKSGNNVVLITMKRDK